MLELQKSWYVMKLKSSARPPSPSPSATAYHEHLISPSLLLSPQQDRYGGPDTYSEDWSSKLSLGEQQRIAAARVLLQNPPPDILFLDEVRYVFFFLRFACSDTTKFPEYEYDYDSGNVGS